MSYRVVEQPVRHGTAATPVARRRTLVFTSAAAAVVVAAVFVATTGAPTPRVVVADQIRRAVPAPQQHKSRGAGIGAAPAAVPRVLVVGNSIALYGADEGFKRLHTSPPLDVLNLGSVGCRLLPEETRSRYPHGETMVSQSQPCRSNWALAVTLYRPDVVVMLVSEPTDADHEINGVWTHPCEPGYDDMLTHELHDQIHLLASKGARVIIATAAYAGLPFKSLAWFQHNDCQNAIFRRVVADEPRAVLADVFRWICPQMDQDCDTNIDGIVLRPDGVHFRDASARVLAAWVIAQGQEHGVFTGVHVEGADAREATIAPTR